MIFDLTKDYVPESYVDSRDYRVFLRQLGMLTTVFKYNIDHFPDLYDPDDCPDHLLPLLASMVGYKYNPGKSVDSNRKIIKYFPYLLRNRGSELGIKLAVILSINTDPNISRTYSMNNIMVSADVDAGIIYIYYPRVNIIDWNLIEAVRPVGMRIELIPSDLSFISETLLVRTRVSSTQRDQYFDNPKLNEDKVGFDVNYRTD